MVENDLSYNKSTKIYTRIAPKSKIKQIKTIKWENLFIF